MKTIYYIILLFSIFLAFVLILLGKISVTSNYGDSLHTIETPDTNCLVDLSDSLEIRRISGFRKMLSETEYPTFNLNDYPLDGLVKNEEIAIKLAEIYWFSEYGKDIYDYKPFVAVPSIEGTWKVAGIIPYDRVGGVFEIEIRRRDGKILFIGRGK